MQVEKVVREVETKSGPPEISDAFARRLAPFVEHSATQVGGQTGARTVLFPTHHTTDGEVQVHAGRGEGVL